MRKLLCIVGGIVGAILIVFTPDAMAIVLGKVLTTLIVWVVIIYIVTRSRQ